MKKFTLLILIVFTITVQGQNKLFSGVSEYYDVNRSSWQNYSGVNYEYDSNNNVISETRFEWTAGKWANSIKSLYTYNVNNKITEILFQNWNGTTNSYENVDKDTYTYISGQPTEIVYYEWISLNWVLKDKTVISYNSNNLPSGALSYLWNGTQYVNDSRYTATYNVYQKLTEDLGEKWINSNWGNDYKSLYTYNSNNKLLTSRSASWDVFNSIWVERDRADYELDANGNRTKTTYSGSYGSKFEYNYDISSLMASFANPFKDKSGIDYFGEDYPYVNKLLGYNEFSYNTLTSSYEQSRRTTFNYSNSITLSADELQMNTSTIIVFPNPTKDFLTIQISSNTEIDKIIVSDISGKTVLQQNQNGSQVNVQNLSKGMYLLQVLSGAKNWQSKFVKE